MSRKYRIGHLVYELTEACNQNCRFCYNHWRPEGARPADRRLAARTLRRILSQAEVGSISFSGGEPTLLPNVHDLALRCGFAGCRVNVLTNGSLLDDAAITNFKSLGISALQISFLSADPAVHDYLTGVPGSWDKAVSAIDRAIRILGADHLAIVLIITALNAGTVAGTLEFLKERGVLHFMVNRFNIGGNGIVNLDELSLSDEGLRAAFATVSKFAVRNPQMRFTSGVCTPFCILNPAEFPGIIFTSCSTDLQQRPVTIAADGNVRFCNHSPFIMGSIYERSIREILEDETLQARYNVAEPPARCIGCKLFSRCKGGCRAASEQVFGTFSEVDPILSSQ